MQRVLDESASGGTAGEMTDERPKFDAQKTFKMEKADTAEESYRRERPPTNRTPRRASLTPPDDGSGAIAGMPSEDAGGGGVVGCARRLRAGLQQEL